MTPPGRRFGPVASSLVGAGAGIVAAATGFLLLLVPIFLTAAGPRFPADLGVVVGLLLTTAIYVGPVTMVLGLPLSLWLRRKADEGTPSGTVYGLGLIIGSPLGLVSLASPIALVSVLTGDFSFFGGLFATSAGLLFLVPAFFGGAGMGAGCAWATLRRREGPM